MKKHYVYCGSCGKRIIDNISTITREDGESFCGKCASEMSSICAVCGCVSYTWNMTSTSQDEIYCEHCATAIA